MKSLKTLITLIITLVVFILTTAILIGVYVAHPMYNKIENLSKNLDRYELAMVEMELPMSVLMNITEQFERHKTMKPDSKQRLIMTYNSYLNTYIQTANRLDAIASSSDDLINAIAHERLLTLSPSTRTFLSNSNRLIQITHRHHAGIQVADFDGIQTTAFFKALQAETATLSVQQKATSKALEALHNQLINTYYAVTISIFCLLLFVSLTLSVLLRKLIGHNMNYLMNALRQLSKFNYNLQALPPLKPYFTEEREIKNLVGNIFTEHLFLSNIKETGSKHYILDDIINQLFQDIQDILPTDRIGIAFVNYDTESIVAEYGVSNYGRVIITQGFEVPFSSTSLSQILTTKTSTIMGDIDAELLLRPNSKSLNHLKTEGIQSNMIIPLMSDDTVFGFLFFSSKEKHAYGSADLQLGLNICHEIASMLDKTYLTKKMFSNMTRTFANLVERRDSDTGGHLDRMTAYSSVLAEALIGVEKEGYTINFSVVDDLRSNAAVHDIGKVGIPDAILNKPGKLDDEEWRTMQFHAIIGADILVELQQSLKIFNQSFFQTAIDITKFHHERWDGGGYPEGLSGNAIPLSARIVAIADVFDAVSSKRVYKDALSFEEAVSIIRKGSGAHFDPYLVEVFNGVVDKFYRIYMGDLTPMGNEDTFPF